MENKFIPHSRQMLGHCYTEPPAFMMVPHCGRSSESDSVTTPSQPWFDPTSGAGRTWSGEHPEARGDIFPCQPTELSSEYLHSSGLPTPAYNLVNEFDRQGEDPGRRDATGPPVDG